MLFSKSATPHIERAMDALVTADHMVVLLGKAAGALALLGLIASGLYLRYSGAEGMFSYPAMRGLHWLLGLILLMDCLCRLARSIVLGARRIQAAARSREAIRLQPRLPSANFLIAAGYWITLILLLSTGLEALLADRYGISLLFSQPSMSWIKLHSLAFHFLPGFLLLRLFYGGRAYLRKIRPYLYSP
jgi:hypothetical protein